MSSRSVQPDTTRPARYRQFIGQQAEDRALAYLQAQGMRLIQRNYRSIYGEIDLILQHRQTLVFAEVRYQRSNRFMLAAETISNSKQRKIIATARYFLARHHFSCSAMRFDVITLVGRLDDTPEITWLPSAFDDAG